MALIVCGWCRRPTRAEARCGACGHREPRLPWLQRAQEAPEAPEPSAGRPRLTDAEVRRRLASVSGTVEQQAEALGVDARTIRRYRAQVSAS